MKIAEIQSSNAGFFSRFYADITDAIRKHGDEICLFIPNTRTNRNKTSYNQVVWGSKYNWFIHFNLYRILGIQDCFSWFSTSDLIKKLKVYKPDVIHMHVVNVWMLNFPMLVKYINQNNIQVVWTMHDCRAFTGRCAYFDEIGCERWKNGCGNCPQKELYNPTILDNSAWQWKFRKSWIKKIKRLQIVTPSEWLANYVKESFLQKFPVDVIYNGIDIDVFRESADMSLLRDYNVSNKNVILGVAANWVYRKGLTFFEVINEKKRPSEVVVLVGPMDNVEKKRLTAKGIICVGRTSTILELKAWYQVAKVFVNPTLADNFPTTNIESLASGTPVVTFRTGGSAEAIDDTCGIAVEKGNDKALLEAIIEVCDNPKKYSRDNCIKRSQCFSLKQFDKYVELFHKIVNEHNKTNI